MTILMRFVRKRESTKTPRVKLRCFCSELREISTWPGIGQGFGGPGSKWAQKRNKKEAGLTSLFALSLNKCVNESDY